MGNLDFRVTMSWFWAIVFISFGVDRNNYAEAKRVLPSAVIVGTVYCDTCFNHYSTHSIAGATIAVECKNTSPSFQQEVQTNRHGEFKVHLPLSISKHAKKIKGCSVRLISSNQPYCAVAATAASSNLHLKSRKNGTHIFSAGFFTFKPLKQPQLCDQKSSINNINKLNNVPPILRPNDISFPPPIQDPPSDPPTLGSGYLPPLPRLPPLPPLPKLPPLPGFPLLPPASQLSENKMNQPMDLSLPRTPPFMIPPAFPLPSSPPPLFQLPPAPGSTPSSPIPVPSFHFPPVAGFPGLPPAEASTMSRMSFP